MIGGDLIRMADRVIEVLDHKYLVRPIHYEGMRRIEPLEIPTYENSCGCAVATIKRENFIKMKAGINDTKVDTKNSTNPILKNLLKDNILSTISFHIKTVKMGPKQPSL